MQTTSRHRRSAFTFIEGVAVIAVIAVLAALLLQPHCYRRSRSHPAHCISNLKQATLSYLLWMQDQQQSRLPFRTPFWSGGTQVPDAPSSWPAGVTPPRWAGLQNQAWFQFAWISNALENPRMLVCPADRSRRPAGDWSDKRDIGFLNPNYQNQAVSYLLWLDAGYLNGAASSENAQQHILLSDRHLTYDRPAAACSSGITSAREVLQGSTVTGWEPKPKFGHGASGNMAFLDGSVSAVNTPQARALFKSFSGDKNGALHYMNP